MREMSGKTVSIDEMNRSAGHEKEMNRSRERGGQYCHLYFLEV